MQKLQNWLSGIVFPLSLAAFLISCSGPTPVLTDAQKNKLQQAVSFEDKNPEKGKVDGPVLFNIDTDTLNLLATVMSKYDTLVLYDEATSDSATKMANKIASIPLKELVQGSYSKGAVPKNTPFHDGDALVLYFSNSAQPDKAGTNPINTTVAVPIVDYYGVPANQNATQVNKGADQNMTASVVYFDFDKSDVKAQYRDALAQDLSANKTKLSGAKALVAGFCDERGTEEYNLALGQRRADAVKRVLVSLGFTSSNVKTVSYGKDRPADRGHTEEAWAKNRRSETSYSVGK